MDLQQTKSFSMFSGNNLEWELIPLKKLPVQKENRNQIDFEKIFSLIQKKFEEKIKFFKVFLITGLVNLLKFLKRKLTKVIFLSFLTFLSFNEDFQLRVKMTTPNSLPEKTEFFTTNGVVPNGKREEHKFINVGIDDKDAYAYIKRYRKIAQVEMEKFGIPASINLAQALLETNAGKSKLAKSNNNHFGVKCFSKNCKKGHCSNFSDDHHKDFFRIYKSGWQSWRSHSKMIVSGRYKKLLSNGNDYVAWAKGYKKLGYATDKNYALKLISVVEKYKLYQYDK